MNKGYIQIDGKFYKEGNVIMLPTEKAINGQKYISKCIQSFDFGMIDDFHNTAKEGELFYGYHSNVNNEYWLPQHLYILSDEEIKEGWKGWAYKADVKGQIFKHFYTGNPWYKDAKKIIATTDPELNRIWEESRGGTFAGFVNGLPRPSDAFIQKYCELGGIDRVLVEYEVDYDHSLGSIKYDYPLGYKLKVAPDNTITIKPFVEKTYTEQELQDRLDEQVCITNAEWLKKGKIYTRKEVIKLLEECIIDCHKDLIQDKYESVTKWIEQNL